MKTIDIFIPDSKSSPITLFADGAPVENSIQAADGGCVLSFNFDDALFSAIFLFYKFPLRRRALIAMPCCDATAALPASSPPFLPRPVAVVAELSGRAVDNLKTASFALKSKIGYGAFTKRALFYSLLAKLCRSKSFTVQKALDLAARF